MSKAVEHSTTFIELLSQRDETAYLKYMEDHQDFYNIPNVYGWTPLKSACYYDLKNIVFKLLDKNVDINLEIDTYVRTTLMYAVTHCNSNDILIELIRRGANVNYKNRHDESALVVALLLTMYAEKAIILIRAGAEFIDLIDDHIVKYNNHKVMKYIRNIYQQKIIAVIDAERTDKSDDNAMATSFRTTYAVGVVDIISEFII
ncbi:MAG: hypothetical protein Faunusvirus2_31 [Faunusvirus sp.]|jgi:ankyrin repeat protein|uniref:Uncharacterized protein n=1 Tax=Faunusvirus sp. TaxID=2487766 RepID=A0A3G4ZXL7_9VIRU|nr:MAG: hypothetical protein Faunusvirus2_31 [Faunusvirus sp.]